MSAFKENKAESEAAKNILKGVGSDSSNPFLSALKETEFKPFSDHPDEHYNKMSYSLRPTSKRNVMEIAAVLSRTISKPLQERARYAMQAGFAPAGYSTVWINPENPSTSYESKEQAVEAGVSFPQKKRSPVFEIEDVYDEFHETAALAQVLFSGFPALVSLDKNEGGDITCSVSSENKELFMSLDDTVVTKGFFVWTARRSGISSLLMK